MSRHTKYRSNRYINATPLFPMDARTPEDPLGKEELVGQPAVAPPTAYTMESSSLPETVSNSSQDLLQAHLDLCHQAVSYTKSVALAVALDLGVADAIHHRGGSATLPEILAGVGIHPCKLRALRRLMRVLAVSGTFSASSDGHGDAGLLPPRQRRRRAWRRSWASTSTPSSSPRSSRG